MSFPLFRCLQLRNIMSGAQSYKAVIKTRNNQRGFQFGRQECNNPTLARVLVTQILKGVGAPTDDLSKVQVKLTCEKDPEECIEICADDLIAMVAMCVSDGRFSTGVGPTVLLTVAGEQPGQPVASSVSKASKGYSSHWKVCLRWCPAMRRVLLRLPECLRTGAVLSDCMQEDTDSMFFLLKHVSGLRAVVKQVCTTQMLRGNSMFVPRRGCNNGPPVRSTLSTSQPPTRRPRSWIV